MNIARIEGNFQATADDKCALAGRGMVATAFPEATRAGVKPYQIGDLFVQLDLGKLLERLAERGPRAPDSTLRR